MASATAKKKNTRSSGARGGRKTKKASSRRLPNDITGLILIGLGLFTGFAVLTPWAGVVGVAVQAFMKGVFGLLAYVMPFLLVFIGWLTLIAYNRSIHGGKVALSCLAAVLLVVFLHLFWHKTILQMEGADEGFGAYLGAAYAFGKEKARGMGALGGLLSFHLHMLLGTAGSFVVVVIGLIASFFGLTRLSLTKVTQKVSQSISTGTKNAFEYHRTQALERRQEKEAARLRWQEEQQYAPQDDPQPYLDAQEYYEEEPVYAQEPPPSSRSFWDEDLRKEEKRERRQEATFTPLDRRESEAAFEQYSDEEIIEPLRPLLRPPELELRRREEVPHGQEMAQPSQPIQDEDEQAAYARLANESETLVEMRPAKERVVPARVRRDTRDPAMIAANPSVADFDDPVSDKEPETITAVPKEEIEYLYGSESEAAIDPDALPPYRFPPLSLLSPPKKSQVDAAAEQEMLRMNAEKLEDALSSFGIEAKVEHVSKGPAITRYELRPAKGVKISKITSLAEDIALNMAAMSVRIEAPIPGKPAVGIELANETVDMVSLREVLESGAFHEHASKLAVALGKDIAGDAVIADLARMPHLLIAGATGSGKSVCINSLIASILFKATPDEVKLIMIDPKVVELSVYNGIPHLLIPVVTDPKKAAGALGWAVVEMDERYKKFAKANVRDLKGYNEFLLADGEQPLPQIVVIIDELADLMMVAPGDVEDRICRLAQLARAAGIHLVIATQRPSVNVITGVIKANIPSRIAFAVSSQVDSRTILDVAGAEKLLGRGDMLFDPSGASKARRVQGAFISDSEVNTLVDYVKARYGANYDPDFMETIERAEEPQQEAPTGDGDELLQEAVQLAIDSGQISASMLQRRFRVGYARAGRLLDEMEKRKLISGFEGSKPRQVLVTRDEYDRIFGNQ